MNLLEKHFVYAHTFILSTRHDLAQCTFPISHFHYVSYVLVIKTDNYVYVCRVSHRLYAKTFVIIQHVAVDNFLLRCEKSTGKVPQASCHKQR